MECHSSNQHGSQKWNHSCCINMFEKDGVKKLVKSFVYHKRDYNLCIKILGQYMYIQNQNVYVKFVIASVKYSL